MKGSVPVVVSLNKLIGESSTIEELVDDGERNFVEELDLMKDEIRRVLTEKEYDILCNRYGIDGHDSKTRKHYKDLWSVLYIHLFGREKGINKLRLISINK